MVDGESVEGERRKANKGVGCAGEGGKVAMGTLECEGGVLTLGQPIAYESELREIMEQARTRGGSEPSSAVVGPVVPARTSSARSARAARGRAIWRAT